MQSAIISNEQETIVGHSKRLNSLRSTKRWKKELDLNWLTRNIPVKVVLFVGIQKKQIGMAWFSDALSVDLQIMQTVLERGISPTGRFFRGKLLKNKRCVNPLIVAMGNNCFVRRNIGSVSYKPLGLQPRGN